MNDHLSEAELERIDHTAAEWLIRRDAGLSAAEQDEFFSWLAADPRHGERFAQHQRTWKEFNLLAQWRPEHSAEPNPDLLAKPRAARRRWARIIAWTAPLAAAAALAFGWLGFRADSAAHAQTALAATAHYSQRVLEDGSTVELRDDSEIAVAFSAGERRVQLVRGEAFFTVAKNPARPFIVHASGVDVRAIGTAFNVRLAVESVEVLVTEGKVQVAAETLGLAAAPQAPDNAAAAMNRRPAFLQAGERAIVSLESSAPAVVIASVSDEQISRTLAWQPRLLDFNSAPLSEVVAEFNARNVTQLVLGDDELATMPFIASIRSDNVEGFVRLLEAGGTVRAERHRDRIVLRVAK